MSTIRAIDRAFAILQIIADHPDGVGINMLAQQVDLPKSTTSRIVATLEHWEAVTRTTENQLQIGPQLIRLVGQQPLTQNLATLSRPILQEIADETGESVALCVLDQAQVYFLDQVESHQDIRVRNWAGEYLPLHVSSAGKVFLAYGNPALVEAVLQRPLVRYSDQTIVSPNSLRQQLPQIVAQGYAISYGEFATDIFGLSVPVFDADQQVIAAINLYGPKFRLQALEEHQPMIRSLVAGATRLAQRLR
ncbi:MAG: IclR family transcriptional regulator [Chloroflexota bacterium]